MQVYRERKTLSLWQAFYVYHHLYRLQSTRGSAHPSGVGDDDDFRVEHGKIAYSTLPVFKFNGTLLAADTGNKIQMLHENRSTEVRQKIRVSNRCNLSGGISEM